MFLHLCAILFKGGWLSSTHHRSHDQRVCIQRGLHFGGLHPGGSESRGVCIQRGLHPKGSASRGSAIRGYQGGLNSGGLHQGGLHAKGSASRRLHSGSICIQSILHPGGVREVCIQERGRHTEGTSAFGGGHLHPGWGSASRGFEQIPQQYRIRSISLEYILVIIYLLK